MEWRPSFDQIMAYLYQPSRQARLFADENCVKALVRLAERSRKYFGPISDDLVLEIGQWANPLQARYLSQYVSMLVVFMPNGQWTQELVDSLQPPTGLLWSSASRRLEALNMLLISRIVKQKNFQVDWESWCPALFNLLRRHLKLPGGADPGPKAIAKWNAEEKPGNRMIRSIHSDFLCPFAKWIVRVMTDDNGILLHLESFLLSMDSFCHPSNGGSWSGELNSLCGYLVDAMNKRLFRVNPYSKLSDETVTRFSKALWPLVNKLVYSKNFFGALRVQEIVKCLANISPVLIIPDLVVMTEPSLTSLTEPHRTNASIGVLGAVGRKMLDPLACPAGLANMVGLLHAVIPGIDANDPYKTMASLAFISNVLTVMPLSDVSASHPSGEDCVENGNAEATAGFESFVLLFLDQCFLFLRNMTRPTEGNEAGSSALLVNTWDLLFQQLSPSLLSLALGKVMKFIRNGEGGDHVHAALALGHLVGKAAMRSPEYDRVVTIVIDEIISQLERGTGSEEHETDESCARLICHLHILHRLFSYIYSGSAGIDPKIATVFEMASRCRHKSIVRLAAKSMKALIKALSGIYPRDWASTPSQAVGLSDFGKLYRLDEVRIGWRMPTVDQLKASLEICKTYLVLVHGAAFQRTQLMMARHTLKAILSLRSNILLMEVSSALLSDVDAIFASLVDLLLSLKLVGVENQETLIETLGLALTYRGIGREEHEEMHRSASYMKSALTYYRKDPLRPRYWYVKRAHVLHLCRMELMSYQQIDVTPRKDEILLVLGEYSMSQFSDLHEEAQHQISVAAMNVPQRSRDMLADWATRITTPSLDDESLKALLAPRGAMLTICSEWGLLSQYLHWLLPLNDRPGMERVPKVHDLITGMFVESARAFCGPPSPWLGNAKLLQLVGAYVDPSAYNQEREKVRGELMEWMIALYPKSTWRTQIMLSTYLLILLTPYDHIPLSLVNLYVSGAASDVHDVRFSSLQASRIALHTYSRQTQSQLGDALLDGPPTTYDTGCIDRQQVVLFLRRSEVEEAEDSGKLEFRPETCRHVQSLADILGPSILETITEVVSGDEQAVWSAGRQRACAEWIGGALKSLLYTLDPTEFHAVFNAQIQPLVKLGWSRCGVDSARYWFAALFFASRGRSPSTCAILYSFVSGELLKALANTGASSTELVLLVLAVHGVIKSGNVPVEATSALIPAIMDRLFASHYLMVRRESAQLLRELARLHYNPKSRSSDLLSSILDGNDSYSQMQVKSLVELAHACFHDPVLTGIWPCIPTTLIPTLLAAHHSDEIEMQLATRLAVRRASTYDYCPSSTEFQLLLYGAIAPVVRQAEMSVHVRKLAVEAAGLVYGRNYVLFDEGMSEEYLRVVLLWLEDQQLEIREAAGLILTPLLHTRPALAESLAAKLIPSLRATLPSIKSPLSIPTRHSLTLQSSSLILSQPYRLPSHCPPILLLLTRYLPDRAPISAAVRKTFSEFKRTHMEGWAVERVAFSEEELDAISELLVSPSYYA